MTHPDFGGTPDKGRWALDDQVWRRGLMRRGKQQLTLGDVIKVVSQVSHGDHEMVLVVTDLINRGLVKLRGPYKQTKVVRRGH